MPSLSTSGRRTHFFFDTIMNEGDVDVVVVDGAVVVVDKWGFIPLLSLEVNEVWFIWQSKQITLRVNIMANPKKN